MKSAKRRAVERGAWREAGRGRNGGREEAQKEWWAWAEGQGALHWRMERPASRQPRPWTTQLSENAAYFFLAVLL
jgi:hypothetical protein